MTDENLLVMVIIGAATFAIICSILLTAFILYKRLKAYFKEQLEQILEHVMKFLEMHRHVEVVVKHPHKARTRSPEGEGKHVLVGFRKSDKGYIPVFEDDSPTPSGEEDA